MLRAIPSTFHPPTVQAIDAALAGIAAAHGVRLLLAIESGSRAWGFPSPDSDYDCRFLYVHPRDRYLSLWPQRDVIELPLDGLLDINGWDLAKALRLLVKGNAVVAEWLASPIAYAGDAAFRDACRALAARCADRASVGRHYLHLGERQMREHLADAQSVALKKLFYVLRPAAALRWLRANASAAPPMHFPTLMAESDPPERVANLVADLIVVKSQQREIGRAPMPPELAAFIINEFTQAHEWLANEPPQDRAAAHREADAFFLSVVR